MVGCERKPLVWGSAFARALFILWRRLALGHNSNHRRVLDKVDIEERVVVNLDALVVTLPAAVEIMKVLHVSLFRKFACVGVSCSCRSCPRPTLSLL